MKYIKTFEDMNTDLRVLLCNFLSKIIPTDIKLIRHYNGRDMNKNTMALALTSFDNRKNISYRYDIESLVIETCPVNDKQLRKEINKSKLKVTIIPHSLINSNEKEFISNLIYFIEDIFKKYSYFYKRTPTYKYDKLSINDYYINTSDIENIMNDLEQFEIWTDQNKFNL